MYPLRSPMIPVLNTCVLRSSHAARIEESIMRANEEIASALRGSPWKAILSSSAVRIIAKFLKIANSGIGKCWSALLPVYIIPTRLHTTTSHFEASFVVMLRRGGSSPSSENTSIRTTVPIDCSSSRVKLSEDANLVRIILLVIVIAIEDVLYDTRASELCICNYQSAVCSFARKEGCLIKFIVPC